MLPLLEYEVAHIYNKFLFRFGFNESMYLKLGQNTNKMHLRKIHGVYVFVHILNMHAKPI